MQQPVGHLPEACALLGQRESRSLSKQSAIRPKSAYGYLHPTRPIADCAFDPKNADSPLIAGFCPN